MVDEATIVEISSTMTGIPLSRLGGRESKKILQLEDELRKRVIGQDEALEALPRASGGRGLAYITRGGR